MTTAAAPRELQTSHAVLMVRPAHFAANAETAGSNHFQRHAGGGVDVAARAAREFDALAVALAAAGVRVHAFAGRRTRLCPTKCSRTTGSACMPTAPRCSTRCSRRAADASGARRARRAALRAWLPDLARARSHDPRELAAGSSKAPAASCWIGRTAWPMRASPRARARTRLPRSAASSATTRSRSTRRTHTDAAIYHTNVLLSIGTRFAALCTARTAAPIGARVLDAARGERPRDRRPDVRAARGVRGQPARAARPRQRDRAVADGVRLARARRSGARSKRHGELVIADVGTIESYGGGSVRCMLAEVGAPAGSRPGASYSVTSACRKLPPQICW